ncbi:Os02g0615400 [Oryza sativa Japonica Group]|uniref:Os02g0615400 protein n=1 Tax=Oryza sativa subsp. japonica TaxID=39947 RepID=C7IYF3_ORYSJ|nr:Os02g0615400 [Oryza sativa Japonica Group]|eukprot:NP_001173074.1 Os02g0615400 [Oryza sativa Japonica Group]
MDEGARCDTAVELCFLRPLSKDQLPNLVLLVFGKTDLQGEFATAVRSEWRFPSIPISDMCSEQEQPVKLAMFIQLVLLLLFYGVGNVVHCSTVHEFSIDLQSLLDFKKGITERSKRSLKFLEH